MVRSAHALALALALVPSAVLTCIRVSAQSSSLGSLTVLVQTFGRPRADFPATIQIHSPSLDSDLSTVVDKPSNVLFPNLPPGAYHVLVSSAGLSPAQLDLTLSSGQSVELSLILDHLFPLILESRYNGASLADQINELPISVFSATFDSLLTLDPGKPNVTPPSASSACSLDQVLPRVSAHTREFVDNVNRITAMEVRELERRRRNGRLEDSTHQKGRYVANIELLDSRHLSVEEHRDGYSSMSGFMVANGSPSLVLIFHPIHLDEFKIACVGLSTWQGTPVYLLDFQQRPDRPNTMSEFRNARGTYDVSLKGTAWVDATTFQVVHLETDLLTRVPELLLEFEHQSLDYGPVIFATRGVSLWLPKSADISVHIGGKQFNARHHYSDYRLFVVDTGQKIAKPKDVSN